MVNCVCGHSEKEHTECLCDELKTGCKQCNCVAFFPADKDQICECGHKMSQHDTYGCVFCECLIKA